MPLECRASEPGPLIAQKLSLTKSALQRIILMLKFLGSSTGRATGC